MNSGPRRRFRMAGTGILAAFSLTLAGVAGIAAPGGDTLDSIRPKVKARVKAPVRKPTPRKPAPAKRTAPVAKGRPLPKPGGVTAVRVPTGPTSVPVTARLPGDTLANGRVAWWPIKGNAKDIVGGNDGALRRGVSAVPAMVGVGLQFDGNGSGIQIPDTPALQFTGSFTISLWVRVEAFPPSERAGQLFFRGDRRGGMDPYNLCVVPDGMLAFQVDSGNGATLLRVSIPPKVPVHVSAMLDAESGKMRVYLDGRLAGEMKTTYRPFRDLVASEHAGIGIGNTQYSGEHEQAFYGTLDDLQVHNRALSPEEVAALARR